ncbi:MAG: GGDEF domain-containing protein [Burkholderiales bacterium]|nr:GGDEF domain-containing protein [Burkholderiales bacterium]
MFHQALSVLLVDADPAVASMLQADGCVCTAAADAGAAREFDAVVIAAPTRAAQAALRQRPELAQAAFDSAVLALVAGDDLALELELLSLGVEAVVSDHTVLVRALRHAVMRKRVERSARTAYSTDLATGLPHQAQLLEHMTQLLALREREPAPMVLLVLRIEGYASAAARLGGEAANVLRRKVAVRLRAALRASDVVAAIGPDAFGILLGRLESRGDGERVAAKLVQSLRQPLVVAGQPCAVAATVGLALYPDHGKDARTLMQRASAQAGSVATVGGAGYAASVERGSGGTAANDPE